MPILAETKTSPIGQFFIYGAGGSRKTWWACAAAEAGYNILYINGDTSPTILSNLTPEARARIYHLDVRDFDNEAFFSRFMACFCNVDKVGNCFINETTRRVGISPFGGATKINVGTSWGPNCIVIIDHYTMLVGSANFNFAKENSIDVTEADKPDWDGYRWVGQFLTTILDQLRKLPCHLVVIGHSNVYEKAEGKGIDRKIIFQREQPRSCSNPHGMSIADKFQEVYLFYKEGTRNFIDMNGHRHKDAQSKIYTPGRYEWDNATLANTLAKMGVVAPDKNASFPVFDIIPERNLIGGKQPPLAGAIKQAASTPPVLTIPTPVKKVSTIVANLLPKQGVPKL